ncbi:MAG: single-stranded DNA-binding protein [Bacteroidales bacterium]
MVGGGVNMNSVILIGRWTKDIDLKFIPNTGAAVATGTIAVDRRFQKDKEKEADFINIVMWNKTAENASQYTGKGKLCGIKGRLQSRSYEKDGHRVYITEVVADEVQFLDYGEKKQSLGNNDYTEVGIEDGEIPF